MTIGATTGAAETIGGSYLNGDGFPSPTQLFTGTVPGGGGGGGAGSHAITSRLRPPGSTPIPGASAVPDGTYR